MAARLKTFASRMVVQALAIHAVLLPLLFFALLFIVKQSHEENFVNDVRKYSRFIADMYELEHIAFDNTAQATHLLDSALLGSGGVYAELISSNTHIKRDLLPGDRKDIYKEDFDFGQHNDHIYFLSTPVHIPEQHLELRMGFDEKPTIEKIETARNRLALVLILYLLVRLIAVAIFSKRMTRPLKKLQNDSRRIAKGHYTNHLQVDSDLVEIKELAFDLEAMRKELVDMNSSLQREISNKEDAYKQRERLEAELRQSQKLESVGVMAGGIAHEFNNILASIFLYTEQSLHELPADSPLRGPLERILKSSKRAKALIQQILTFSRQSEQEFRPVNLRSVVIEACELLSALIPSTIELKQKITAEDCIALADRNQISQLIINLGNNAYQAIGNQSGIITVCLERIIIYRQSSQENPRLHEGRYVKLTVQDTGHGISQAELARVFEPFYTTRAVGNGTGLGLSVVHGIVMSHHGDITVESGPGKGTVFKVYLPEYEQ
ncbi:MAG: ATP-binding protein [Gammaproteobacteria bacterium]|jgi:signal transduction histidine kinase